MRTLVTGGTGLLGKELQKILKNKTTYIGFSDMDIRDEKEVKTCIEMYKPDLVIHLAADVTTDGLDKQTTYDTNVIGTRNVAKHSKKLIYMSTDYVFDGKKGNYTEKDYPNPLQFYGLTKLLGEYECRYCPEYIILRASLKPRPFRHANVPKGMITSGDYVDRIAKMIKEVVLLSQTKKLPEIINIGTGKKLMKDLASETRKVGDIDIESLAIKIPLDTTLDLKLWKSLI